ncbi:hypothetical protein OHB26_18840 [Nocardia sp. NBC_01503]|uniref:glycosyl hydrolase family 65 protein n=1 Tax=Nocardia sp. NBC_01503 TaxID=2975997 RepID=UPI002E7C32E2|nr:glycosyl hydrolase family 65 protein [Nocardia sp. NBC_01503]WTL29084.1 hypothetical protein OHB26_18840 [Nocardia sp. NBC_01503]
MSDDPIRAVADSARDHDVVPWPAVVDGIGSLSALAGTQGRDSGWIVRENPARPEVSDVAVFTVGSGGVASRGTPEEAGTASTAGVLVAGVYTAAGPDQHLLEGPCWTAVTLDPPGMTAERFLDLRAGALYRVGPTGGFRSVRFACADRPGVMVMRVAATGTGIDGGEPLRVSAADVTATVTEIPMDALGAPGTRTRCVRIESATGGAIVAAAAQHRVDTEDGCRLERVAAIGADTAERTGSGRVVRELRQAWEHGIDGLLAAHGAAWSRRWSSVGIDLPDDPETELAVRFALYQLWTNADAHGESAVGARGISGTDYLGHIFWDADAFVLPAMVSIDPEAAEAIVAYRLRRLGAARERARAAGYRGARFPWESAADGTDVTPRSGFLGGTTVPIRTGILEEHITADIAWAADRYAEWTGRRDFVRTTARELLTETARYWASRCRVDARGQAHLEQVIGPDEYHESVDDNAFTNVMARWNLRRAARLEPEDHTEATEFAAWRALADRIVDQLRPDGRYEQFRGYFGLEPLLAAAVARPPVAADVLLGQHRVTGSQLIKQPDVLMLHHLVPEEVAPASLTPNLDFYGPRTTHGSSLSLPVMATLLARAGRPDSALEMLGPALRLDLDDRNGTTAGGLHMATFGGVWQAMLTGFAGVRVRDGVMRVRPMLPHRWSRLGIAFRVLGRHIRLDITPGGTTVRTDGPVVVAVGGHPVRVVTGESWWPATTKGTM